MSENRKIMLKAEDYKVLFSAVGALEIAESIASDEEAEPSLRTCASAFVQRMTQAMDDSVFNFIPPPRKAEAGQQLAKAWADAELEIRKRCVMSRVVVDTSKHFRR